MVWRVYWGRIPRHCRTYFVRTPSLPLLRTASFEQVLVDELRDEQFQRDIDAFEEGRLQLLESDLSRERELRQRMEIQVEELRTRNAELEAKVTELAAMLRARDARGMGAPRDR
jgi:predicted nuclease with TOPRIM domain